MTAAQIVVYLLVGLMALAGSIGAAVVAARQKANEAAVTRNDERIAALEARIDKLESRDRAWANYVHRLRSHIVSQLPPPPPEWPKDLDV